MATLTPISSGAKYRPELHWSQIIYAEIASVTSSMRKNQRFNSDPTDEYIMEHNETQLNDLRGMDKLQQYLVNINKTELGLKGAPFPPAPEHPLLLGFTELKLLLGTVSNLRDLDPSRLLRPFLNVIRSGDTTGAVTGAALLSVQNFIIYRVLDPHHPDLPAAIAELTHAVTRCKFEATDVVSDEVILTNILRLLQEMALSESGKKCITDKGMCEMVEVAFGMHFQGRISGLLRQSAQETLLVLTRCMFERLVVITREAEHRESVKGRNSQIRNSKSSGMNLDEMDEFGQSKDHLNVTSTGKATTTFGLPAILEFTRVLITLINPSDLKHTDTLHRSLALKLATTALEVGGTSLAKWVAAGFELEIKNIATKEDIPETNELDMSIVTEQPATFLSIGANGAKYITEEVETKIDEKKEQTMQKPEDTKSELMEGEIDFSKIAVKIKLMVIDDFCKHLFKLLLVQNTTRISPPTQITLRILALATRTISTLFATMGKLLLPQKGWFLQTLMEKCEAGVTTGDTVDWIPSIHSRETSITGDSESSKPNNSKTDDILDSNVRELYLDLMLQICRSDYIFTELYLFYDTSVALRGNSYSDDFFSSQKCLFEQLIQFYTKFSIPDMRAGGSITKPIHQALAFDGVMTFLRCLYERRNAKPVYPFFLNPEKHGLSSIDGEVVKITPQMLTQIRKQKELFFKGAELFNASFKKGIPFFQENGFLPDPSTPQMIASFFFASSHLSKSVIGDYIGRKENEEVLVEYVKKFNFQGKRIDEALRMFLEEFRLPGESQMIDRIVMAFSKQYYGCLCQDPQNQIASEDAVYILAFSIIMLNTDLHNPQNPRRMIFDDFTKILKGQNGDADFDQHYLREIYNEIRDNEIVLPEEHGGDLGFNFAWKQLLADFKRLPDLAIPDSNVFDKDMFSRVWNPVIATIFYTFENAEDSTTVLKVATALKQFSELAANFKRTDIIDFIVNSLLRISGIDRNSDVLPVELDFTLPREELELQIAKKTQFDQWALDFGQNFKGKAAVVFLFDIISEYSNCLDESWRAVVSSTCTLFLHQLLTTELMITEHFLLGQITIPRLVVNATSTETKTRSSRKETSLLSSFAQFLSISSNELELELVKEALLYEQMAKVCISSCKVEDLLNQARYMEISTVKKLLASIVSSSYHKSDGSSGIPTSAFSDSSVFLLEVLFKILSRNKDRLVHLWPVVVNHLEAILSPTAPSILTERAIVNLLRLLVKMSPTDEMIDSVFRSLEILPKLNIDEYAAHTVAGLLNVARNDFTIFAKHDSRWSVLLNTLSITATHPIASIYSFELTSMIIAKSGLLLTPQKFGECVDLLLLFSKGLLTKQDKKSGKSPNNSPSKSNSVQELSNLSPTYFMAKSSLPNPALELALQAIEKLAGLHMVIPKLAAEVKYLPRDAWSEFWLPVLSGLGQQCCHPWVEIRNQALTLLQQIFLSDELKKIAIDDPSMQYMFFEMVIFPLIDDLSKSDHNLDKNNANQTNVRACGLLTKVFLRYSNSLLKEKDFEKIWATVLDHLCKIAKLAIETKSSAQLEGIQESLKNTILVLNADQILVKDSDLWKSSFAKVKLVYPEFELEANESTKDKTDL